MEAAEEVCSGESVEQDDALDLLSRLVDKSLVVAEAEQEGAMRYRMLEPVRQYARERLEESGTVVRVRERHARYYLKLAEEPGGEEADPRMKGSPPVAWLKRMGTEHANLRAALSWSLDIDAEEADGGREELGLRLAVALWWFWHTLGSLTEGRRYLEGAVSNSTSPTAARLRARALNGAAGIVIPQGDYGAAIALAQEGLALYRELGDEEGIASALTDLGLIALWGQRDDISVSAVMEELQELKPHLENRRTLAWLLVLEGMIAFSRGDPEQSVALHEESLEIFREMGDTGAVINTLGQLGGILFLAGDYERALPLIREDLRLGWESDYALPIQISLYFLACAATFREQPVRAARLWGAVEGMEEAYGVHVSPIALSQSDYEGRLAAARSQLEEEAWLRAWEEGKAMSLERAVEYGLSEEEERELPTLVPVAEEQPPTDEPAETLTRRELEVALLVGRGLTNRQIASELSVSRNTANNHVARILRKLGLGSRAQIAAWVTEHRSPSSERDT